MSELLKISGLWGGYKEGVDILRGIDLTINEGETIGIIGLNGSGKSTLGKAIVNMIPIRNGKIEFNGTDISTLPTHAIVRQGISIMQQGGQVFPNLSVWENLELAFGKTIFGKTSNFEQIREFIPLLQHTEKELKSKMADKLSGGQKHQLALAMAIASAPRLVILDEPSAGLSPIAVEEMYLTLSKVYSELAISIILIEQNVSKAISFCDRTIMLQTGALIKEYNRNSIHDIEKAMFNN